MVAREKDLLKPQPLHVISSEHFGPSPDYLNSPLSGAERDPDRFSGF